MEAAHFKHHLNSYVTLTDDIMLSTDSDVESNPLIDKIIVEVKNFRLILYNYKAIVSEFISNLNEIKNVNKEPTSSPLHLL